MKIRSILSYFVLIVGVVLAILFGCNKSASVPEGVTALNGVGKGFGGDIKLVVHIKDDVITDVIIKEHSETEGISNVAREEMPKRIVENQTYNVDTVSGATYSSNGIKEAVKNALTSAGLENKFSSVVSEKKVDKSGEVSYLETDVVVVGAGGAGMVSSIVLADAGKKVILLESQPMVGGNTVRSTGGLNATKTTWQDANEFKEEAGLLKTLNSAKETYANNQDIVNLVDTVNNQYEEYKNNGEGYFDSVELMELDTMVGGKGINKFNLVKALCEGTKDAIDWLDGIGVILHNVASFGGASVKRIHRPVNDAGQVVSVGSYMVPIFNENVQSRNNITLMLNTTCEKLIDEDGKVVGVEAVRDDGSKLIINSNATILATGGFGANLPMVSKYKPELDGFMTTNAPGILGQGIDMAVAIGANVVDMDQIQIHPTVEANSAALITEGLRGDGAILVNSNGKRFIDEVGTRDVVSKAEIEQPGSFSWLIVDKKMVDASQVIQGYIKKEFTKEGETYEELADAIGVDKETFADTMNKWNECVNNKEDKDFGRTSFANPLDTAPYYAIKVTAGIHHTMGGLAINEDAEVLNAQNYAIDGLFACGEVTGGIHGANRLGGNADADIVVFGRIAAESAIEYIEAIG